MTKTRLKRKTETTTERVLAAGEVWRVDGRKGPLTIQLSEAVRPGVDDFFSARIIAGRAQYASIAYREAQRYDGLGTPGTPITLRTTLTRFVERVLLPEGGVETLQRYDGFAPHEFAKDHWSLLGYLETLVVDRIAPARTTGRAKNHRSEVGGTIDNDRVRCNPLRHAAFLGPRQTGGWQQRWGTEVREGGGAPGGTRVIGDHDDWDCLADLIAAGYVVADVATMEAVVVTLTDAGLAVAAQIRQHKARGGSFATFVPPTVG